MFASMSKYPPAFASLRNASVSSIVAPEYTSAPRIIGVR